VCDSECASLITPPSIYIQPSFLGGGDQDLSQEVKELIEALPFAESLEDFASIVEDSPLEAVEEAISLQPDQPRRRQLSQWLAALSKRESVAAEMVDEAIATRPSLESYREGEEVWFWHSMSEQGWVRG
jgi:hypothetical protein